MVLYVWKAFGILVLGKVELLKDFKQGNELNTFALQTDCLSQSKIRCNGIKALDKEIKWPKLLKTDQILKANKFLNS